MTTCAYISSALVLVANRLTTTTTTTTAPAERREPPHQVPDSSSLVPSGSLEMDVNEEDKLISEAVEFLEKGLAEMPHPHADQLGRMAAALGELNCRARIGRERFRARISGCGGHNNNPLNIGSSAVAWLEKEARKSASFSALDLVQAFTGAEQKTMATRLAYGGAV